MLFGHQGINIKIGKSKLIILDQAFVSGVNFLTGLFLARTLGASGYGLYILSFGFVLFFSSVQVSIIVSQMMVTGPVLSTAKTRQYYFIVRVAQLLLAIIFALLILLFSNAILGHLENWHSGLTLPLAMTVFSFLFQDYIRRELFSKDRTLSGLSIDVLCYGSRLAALIIFAYMDRLDVGTTLLIIAATSSLSFIYILDKSMLSCRPEAPAWSTTAFLHWKNGKWLLLNTFSIWLSSQLILYMTGFMLTTSEVGRLGATQNILGFANILFQAMENFVPSHASKTFAASGLASLNRYLIRIATLGGIATLMIVIIVGIFSESLLGLIYSGYQEDAWLVWLWGLYFLMGFFRRPLTAGLRVLDDTRSIFQASLIGALFTIILGYLLIAGYGILGSISALCLVQAIILSILFYRYRYRVKQTA